MVVKDTRESLTGLLIIMKPILLAAGIPEEQIRMRNGRHQIKTCAKTYDWLHDLYMSNDYSGVRAIWKLVDPETWRRYKLFEIEGLKEQELLEHASKKLRKAWKTKRPRLLGKDRARDRNIENSNKSDICRAK